LRLRAPKSPEPGAGTTRRGFLPTFGCLRVQAALLDYLRNGTNAARAWYWASDA